MTQDPNKPVIVLRDGGLKVSIFAHRDEKGTRYSGTLVRSYRDEQGVWHDTNYLSNAEFLRAARLLDQAYDRLLMLKGNDAKTRPEVEAD